MIYALFIAWCLTVCGAGLGLAAYRWLQDRRAERLERILAVRKAERAATLRHIADVDPAAIRGTFDALVADVTASDYGYRPEGEAWDEHVTAAIDLASATPIHDELAVEHLRRDLDQWGREGA